MEKSLGDGELNQPYGETDQADFSMDELRFASGCRIMSGVIPDPDTQNKLPVLVFRFADGKGGFFEPIALVETPEEMVGLKRLIYAAVNGAVSAVKQ